MAKIFWAEPIEVVNEEPLNKPTSPPALTPCASSTDMEVISTSLPAVKAATVTWLPENTLMSLPAVTMAKSTMLADQAAMSVPAVIVVVREPKAVASYASN